MYTFNVLDSSNTIYNYVHLHTYNIPEYPSPRPELTGPLEFSCESVIRPVWSARCPDFGSSLSHRESQI